MKRFVARYVEIVVCSLALGVLVGWGRRLATPVADGDTWQLMAPAMLIGAYVGYLSHCYRAGKAEAEAAADDGSRES